jgi:hypothetical protein
MKHFQTWLLAFSLPLFSLMAQDFEVSPKQPLLQKWEVTTAFSLALENASGNCLVSQSKTDEFEVQATTEFDEVFKVTVEGWGTDNVQIKVLYPEVEQPREQVIFLGPGDKLPPSRSVKLEVRIPASALKDFSARTGNGDVQISGPFQNTYAPERKVEIATQNGSIRADQVVALSGAMFSTRNGNIVLRDVQGNVSTETSNGGIETSHGTGSIKAKSVNGDIRIENQNGAVVEAATSQGHILFNNPNAESEVGNTVSGDVQYTTGR